MKSCVARQPIFDARREVYGYELLFRQGSGNSFSGTCNDEAEGNGGNGGNGGSGGTGGDQASARVVNELLHLHGIETLTGGGHCFINITPKFLFDELYTALPSETVVLELLETVEPDARLIKACERAREAGYLLALDDYVCEEKFEPLLPLINILKVDFIGTDVDQQGEAADLAYAHGFKLLAEKVETPEEFQIAREYGYDLFQGYFFCKPELFRKRDLQVSAIAYLHLVEQLMKPRLNLKKLAEIIRQDIALSYKLLRYLNSGAFRFRHKITSIRHALALVGDQPLRKWSSLVVLSLLGSGKPPELLNVCMTRARLCENLGHNSLLAPQAHDLFMTGMFSVLDALLDRPMEELLTEISVPEMVSLTLLGNVTPLRPALDIAMALESGDWDRLAAAQATLGLSEDTINAALREAIQWSAAQTQEMADAGDAAARRGAA